MPATDPITLQSRGPAGPPGAAGRGLTDLRVSGVEGTRAVGTTTWETVGVIDLHKALWPAGSREVRLLAALECNAPGIGAELRLVDPGGVPLTGSVLTTTPAAAAGPEALASAVLGESLFASARTLYSVQLRRTGGGATDRAFCHGAFLQVRYT